MNNKVVDFINLHRDRHVEELKDYLAIPSISALPQHKGDVARCAEWTAKHLERIGLTSVRLIETPGNPVVYGEWLGAEGAPTILFYGHYDVQPVDPLDKWISPPFEATVRDGEIYARGSADDKGQIFMHFKAIEAWLKSDGLASGEHQGVHRGRGGSRLDAPRRLRAREPRDAEGQRRGDLRFADVRSRHPVDLLRPARPGVLPDRRHGHELRSALRLVRRRRGEPRVRARRRSWRR